MQTTEPSGLLRRLAETAPKPGDSVVQIRMAHEAATARVPVPDDVTVEPVRVGALDAEWIMPADAPTSPPRVVLYLHGGGYVLGSLASSRPFAASLARAAHAPLLSLDYRLGPEFPFPAAVLDASMAVSWLADQGYRAEDIVIGGDSAGGGLTVACMLARRAHGLPLPRAGFCLSPWADLTLPPGSMDAADRQDPLVARWLLAEMASWYLAGADPAAHLASPALADLSGLPPLLIHAGGREKLFDDSRALARAARKVGVPVTFESWASMFHVWHAFAPRLPEAVEALDSLERWMSGIWG